MHTPMIVALIIPILLMLENAQADPFVPKQDSVILQKSYLSQSSSVEKRLIQLRNDFRENIDNPFVAENLAKAYLDLADDTNDPRFIGLAEAVLTQWWENSEYIGIQLAKAKIQQHSHLFVDSNHTLDQIISRKPLNISARLLRANNHLVTGEYLKARNDCTLLMAFANSIQSEACFLAATGLTQDAKNTLRVLQDFNQRWHTYTQLDQQQLAWAAGVFADLSRTLGNEGLAESFFKKGLQADSDNNYLLSNYADLLIHQKRYSFVTSLLSDYSNRLHILLRLALVEKYTEPGDKKYQQALKEQFQLMIPERTQLHLREKALYAYHLENDYPLALTLALENWQSQREAGDLLLLLQCAQQQKDVHTLAMLENWLKENRFSISLNNYKKLILG